MGDGRRFSGNCPKGSARAPKLSFPSLRHVASYASFAIHLGDFSFNCEKMTQRTRNKIAQSIQAALRELQRLKADI